MSSPTGVRAIPPRVKACDGCRQLKLRCDAHETAYGGACSRCRRMRRDCTISPNLKRRNRQTKAEMERELDRLRAQYRSPPLDVSAMTTYSSEPPKPADLATAESHEPHQGMESTPGGGAARRTSLAMAEPEPVPQAAGPYQGDHYDQGGFRAINEPRDDAIDTGTPLASAISTENHPTHSNSNTISTFSPPASHPDVYPSTVQPQRDQPAAGSTAAHAPGSETIPRTIGDKMMDAKKIESCISMFAEHYAPNLPGVYDFFQNPNELYDYSTFLFWTIIYVGSRKFSQDPTIIECVAGPLETLTHQSMFNPEHTIPNIQAALLLCLWPPPSDSSYKLQTHAIAGAAMQLAIQKGLPFASREQDFIRIRLEQTEGRRVFRARLWAYCLMVFQGDSLLDGFPFTMPVDPVGLEQRGSAIFSGLPGIISYRHSLHRLQTDAFAAILRSTNPINSRDGDLLNSLICQYDADAQSVPCLDQEDDMCRFALGTVRLLIRAFHFFGNPDSQRSTGILQTFFIACDLIECSSRLDSDVDFGSHCDFTQSRTIGLAAVCILRVLRSGLAAHVDVGRGELMISEAIRISRKRSIRTNDLDSRNAIILTQLWSCPRVFQYKGGTVDGLRLLLRGRLSMSVFFDALWWWRAEFGGSKTNPYLEREDGGQPPQDPVGLSNAAAPVSEPRQSREATENARPPLDPNTSSGMLVDWSYGDDLLEWNWQDLGDPGLM